MDQQDIKKNQQVIDENSRVEKAIREQSKTLVKMGCLSEEEADYYAHNWINMMPSWQQRKYQNAATLLESYRDLRWAISDNIGYIATEKGLNVSGDLLYQNVHELVREISDAEGCGRDRDMGQLRSAIQSAELSVKMLEYVDRALEHIREKPDNGKLLFDILFYTYVSKDAEKKLREEGIPYYQYLKMGKSAYYKNRRKALTLFATCVWGITNLDVKDYITFCMLIEKKHAHF